MQELTSKEKQILYLRKVEFYSQDEIADELNYSKRQIQRIQKSAEEKIINDYITKILKESPIKGAF